MLLYMYLPGHVLALSSQGCDVCSAVPVPLDLSLQTLALDRVVASSNSPAQLCMLNK